MKNVIKIIHSNGFLALALALACSLANSISAGTAATPKERKPSLLHELTEKYIGMMAGKQALNLSKNKLDLDNTEALANALLLNESLKSLNLSGSLFNVAETGGIKAIVEALEQNKTLTTLDLSLNGLESEQGFSIAAYLQENKTLTTLNLSRNTLLLNNGADVAISNAIKNNETLTDLDLSICHYFRLGDVIKVANEIAGALEQNRTLKSFKFGSNRIGDKGALAFAKTIQKNRTLKSLDLSGNQIGDEGANAIADSLENNKTLTTIILDDGEINRNILEKINQFLERNKTLSKEITETWNKIKEFAPALLLQHQGSNFDMLNPDVKLKILKNLYKLSQPKG